jgi:CRISPR/Cas system CMR-associated protein Cmr3 (group 5 of RAMP superfamily)
MKTTTSCFSLPQLPPPPSSSSSSSSSFFLFQIQIQLPFKSDLAWNQARKTHTHKTTILSRVGTHKSTQLSGLINWSGLIEDYQKRIRKTLISTF